MSTQYNYRIAEHAAQELWEREKIYTYIQHSDQEQFTIDTPPPTVSGSLHIGHVFSYTHTDIIARYQRMQGKDVFYPMGFDDNGLATERFVEKTHSIRAHNLSRSDFIALCLKETARVEHDFEQLWRSLGLSIDWSKTYSTIAPNARRAAQYSFLELFKKGQAYRKEEPSIYCTTCRTSISQADLESVEHTTLFNDIIFTAHDGALISVATTRPELLGACVAVLCHPDDTRYTHLVGTTLITPFYNKSVPVIADNSVDMGKGTGIVMCCTFGDQHDIAWFKKHRLPHIRIIGLDGRWTPESGPLAGMNVQDARRTILELLKEKNLLLAQRTISHAVQVHERCKQPVEYQILRQWFINILDHKEALLARADEIRWFPAFMKSRYRDWVEHLSWDWCISRQRFFGIPFPVWHCNDCNATLVAPLELLPIDPQETPYPNENCTNCNGTHITPDTDVMDTWNTSSLTPQINAGWPDEDRVKLPMSMRPQAHDIIRTWAFYTIAKAHFHENTIPWRDIVISGHVLAGKEKISKSQGGSKTTPQGLLDQFPADSIRYWAASGGPGMDTALSENQYKIGLKLITKLWNAAQFCIGHFTNQTKKSTTQQISGVLNEWALHQLAITSTRYHDAFERYEYNQALQIAEEFLYQIFCDNYLEFTKDVLFNPEQYDTTLVASTQAALYVLLLEQLKLFAPFVPHITETIYQLIGRQHDNISAQDSISIHTTRFDPALQNICFDASNTIMSDILEIISQVRKHKSQHTLSLKAPLNSVTILCAHEAQLKALELQKQLLVGITHAQEMRFSIEHPQQGPTDALNVTIALAGHVH